MVAGQQGALSNQRPILTGSWLGPALSDVDWSDHVTWPQGSPIGSSSMNSQKPLMYFSPHRHDMELTAPTGAVWRSSLKPIACHRLARMASQDEIVAPSPTCGRKCSVRLVRPTALGYLTSKPVFWWIGLSQHWGDWGRFLARPLEEIGVHKQTALRNSSPSLDWPILQIVYARGQRWRQRPMWLYL